MASLDRALLATLWREEWRLHARLFGGGRFATLPLVVLTMSTLGGLGLAAVGTEAATIERGIRGVALLFGLYAGTAAFVGGDRTDDLFDDLSLVLSTTETLPLDRTRMLGLFLLKDAAFYAVVFVLPMAVGTAPLAASAAGFGLVEGGSAAVPASVGAALLAVVASVGLLWVEAVALFALGMALTVAAIATRTRGIPRIGLVAGAVALAALAWATGAARLALAGGSLAVGAAALALALLVAAGALVVHDPTHRPASRRSAARLGALADRIGDADGLVVKSLLDLSRSRGGLWKPVVSAGILLAVVAGLLGLVETIVAVRPAPGAFFGAVLSLSAFTTYNWLTSVDALATYEILPVALPAVFRAKRRAFAIVGIPAALSAYAVALLLYPTTLGDAALGALWLVAASAYFFGVTVYLAGFDPNEFLFDPARFGAFGAAVALVVVPALLGSFLPAAGMVPTWAPAAAVGGAVAVGAAGVLLAVRAGPRWAERARAA
ncbi:hypothetical protein [Haloparvum alkalitolerans]|uniref:hypothetical protein n=1 Tax=Haloparvum alkalitolerans TaxID=1042953 RepID=UPI003CF680E5